MQSQIIFRLPKPESLAAAQGRFKMKGILIPFILASLDGFPSPRAPTAIGGSRRLTLKPEAIA